MFLGVSGAVYCRYCGESVEQIFILLSRLQHWRNSGHTEVAGNNKHFPAFVGCQLRGEPANEVTGDCPTLMDKVRLISFHCRRVAALNCRRWLLSVVDHRLPLVFIVGSASRFIRARNGAGCLLLFRKKALILVLILVHEITNDLNWNFSGRGLPTIWFLWTALAAE